jgi:hypothetical protein
MDTELSLGSHLCCFYENEEQQFEVLIPFLSNGIRNGEKCFCIGSAELLLEVKAGLGNEFSIRELLKKGSLEFLEEIDVRIRGKLDPGKALRFVRDLVTRARKGGWPSCRIAGDCSGMFQTSEDREHWLEFEAMLNKKVCKLPAIIICQYNVDEIPAHFMMDILRTHPWVILSGSLYENHFFVEPEEFLQEHVARIERIH